MNQAKYTIQEIIDIATPIAKFYNIQKLYLFGSYARGTATNKSDIDFGVIAPEIKSIWKFYEFHGALDEAFDVSVDLVALDQLSPDTNPEFLYNVYKERILIYDDQQ